MKRKETTEPSYADEAEVSLHDDRKCDVSTLEEDGAQVVCIEPKWIHFCCGEHGIIPWRIDEENCKAFFNMNWTVLTFCVIPHCALHPAESLTDAHTHVPFPVSLDDVLCFMLFADGHADVNSLQQQTTKYHHMLLSTEVNFCTILKMFEFFQTNLQHSALLISFLKELSTALV